MEMICKGKQSSDYNQLNESKESPPVQEEESLVKDLDFNPLRMNMQLVNNNPKIGLIVIDPSALPVDLNRDKLLDCTLNERRSGPSMSDSSSDNSSLIKILKMNSGDLKSLDKDGSDEEGSKRKSEESCDTASVRENNADLPLEWKSVKAVGPGLMNMGNTCYLNAVLQCLTYIPALAQTLSVRHKCASASSCTLFFMEEHIKLMNHASDNVVPKAILSKLKFISKALKLGRQEDAHEFLLALLKSMQTGCSNDPNDPSSIVKSIFEGSIQSIVTCTNCKYESKTTDPMMDIALDIKDCPDIKTAFSSYTIKETMNDYKCDK